MINQKFKSFYHKLNTILIITDMLLLGLLIKLGLEWTYITLYIFMSIFVILLLRYLFLKEFQNENQTNKFLKELNPYDDLSWDEILDKVKEKENSLNKKIDTSRTEIRLYKLLINTFEDPVFVINKKLNVVYSNERFEKKFHFSESGYPYSLLEAIRNFELQVFIESFIQNGKNNELLSSSIEQNENNTPKYYYIKIIPIKFSEHYLITFKDITDKKLAEVIREDFLANFSHEVRTPLTILLAEINQLKNDLVTIPQYNKEHLRQFENIEQNSKRLINLFEDILKLSEIETSKTIHKEEFDCLPLIENIIFELKKAYHHKKINAIYNMESDLINADYKLLELVLLNLIENSIKYSEADLQLTFKMTIENQFYVLEVADNGIGISEDHQGRVFERFFRVDNSRSQKVKGTGLGLAIVKHIMINHKGKIKLESKLDHGTKIKLYFPK